MPGSLNQPVPRTLIGGNQFWGHAHRIALFCICLDFAIHGVVLGCWLDQTTKHSFVAVVRKRNFCLVPGLRLLQGWCIIDAISSHRHDIPNAIVAVLLIGLHMKMKWPSHHSLALLGSTPALLASVCCFPKPKLAGFNPRCPRAALVSQEPHKPFVRHETL